jgi:hypothetical protein
MKEKNGKTTRRPRRLMAFLSILHPFLFAVGSIPILYVSIATAVIYVPPASTIPAIVLSVFTALVLVSVAFLITRQANTAGAIASFFVLGLLHLWPLFFGILIMVILSLLIVRIVRGRTRWEDVTLVLSAISLLVLTFYSLQWARLQARYLQRLEADSVQPVVSSPASATRPDRSPDIFYIILDGYGEADMLRSVHGYDNSAFVAALEQRGFAVASGSQANYPRTILSLASSLNMQYLDGVSSAMGDSILWWPIEDLLKHSQVRSLLEREGYQSVFLYSGWDYTDVRDADVYLNPYPVRLNRFTQALFETTNLRVLAGIERFGIPYPSYNTRRRIILYNFDTLPQAATLPGPKFVFAHILSPHPPYLFDRNGAPLDPPGPLPLFGANLTPQAPSENRQGYLDQLTFINRKTLEMIDGILANSEDPPVIILQGDHGPGVFMDFNDPSRMCLYERYSILNAYYLPGVAASSIPEDISPVNTFRFVFNVYLGTDFELLPNRRYVSSDAAFYRFEDVTGQTHAACPSSAGSAH